MYQYKVEYSSIRYNLMTCKIPVFVSVTDNDHELDKFMCLFDSTFLAEEFRDFVNDLIEDGMDFKTYLQIKHAYKYNAIQFISS